MDPLPQINRVISMIMQQERKAQYGIIVAPTSVIKDTSTRLVNVVDAQRKFGRGSGNAGFQVRGRGNGRVCSFCGRSNHTIETCYKKHGFPPNWGRGGGNSYGSSFASANTVESEEYDAKGTSNVSKNEDGGMMLTRDQYQNLMALLKKNVIDAKGSANMMKASSSVANIGGNFYEHSKKYDDTSWIVDTGATHNTCYDINWFITYREIDPISVKLHNNNIVQAFCKGKVQLNEHLQTDDVLYFPDFTVNLISISKLCKEQDCIVGFESDQCIIQAKKDLRRIGLAKEMNGLYYLKAEKNKNKAAKVSSISASESLLKKVIPPGILWHLRLWHLSHDRMQCMNKLYSYISVSLHTACDVCQMARQKKLPYPISKNNAKDMFDLVHLDI